MGDLENATVNITQDNALLRSETNEHDLEMEDMENILRGNNICFTGILEHPAQFIETLFA